MSNKLSSIVRITLGGGPIRLLGRLAPLLLALFVFAPAAAGELVPHAVSPAGPSGSAPEIASDGNGSIVAVWRELDGDDSAIRAAVKPAGEDWNTSKTISVPAPETESPRVAMDAKGNAVAVWNRSSNGHDNVVQAAVRPANGQWSAPQDLSAPGDSAFHAEVAVEAGTISAVWLVMNERRTTVATSSRTIGGKWTPPQTISGPVGNSFGPVVAMDDNGGAVAAWQWSDGVFLVVRAAVRGADGSWSSPETLSTPGRNTSRPKLVMDAKGTAIAGWIRPNGAWQTAQTAYRPANGTWGPPSTLSRRAGRAAALDLAMTRSGDAIAMWNQSSGKYTSLWSSSRPADAQHWAARVQITNRWKSLQGRVALDLEGNATAVWSSFSTVSASFKPVGGAWQKDYLLSHWDANAMYPAVTSQSARNATAMWVDLGDQDDRVQTVSFDIDTSAKEQQGDQSADEGDDASDDGSDDGSDDEGDDGGSDEGEVFMGTGNADTLVGTPGNDVFYGRGGNDVIDGRGGNDIIFGGAGNDSLRGGTGRDRIFGGPGSDRIEAGQGHDLVLGGNGVDRLAGGHGNDRLLGGAGADRLSGGRGSDVLLGGSGPDVLRGGSGDDTLVAKDRSRDRVFGGRGLDHYRLDRWRDQARSIETRY